jgi:ATP-dependent Lon protease
MEPSVLIVDDEANFLVLMDTILAKEGYRVKTADNGDDALDLLEDESFGAAILDIRMHPFDGLALLAEIKRRSPSTKVIMITAFPTIDCRNDCMKQGAVRFLPKPVEIEELKTVLRTLVP